MKIKELVKIIKQGRVAVIPTDTLYGLVAGAFSNKAIGKIYKIKKRQKSKPLITLISSLTDLKKFKIKPSQEELKILRTVWPGPVSVILSGKAFRLPKKKSLIEVLKKTGPLVAPSANPEGKKAALTIQEARKYFGNQVDFYLAGGRLRGQPSTLIEIRNREIKVLRQGVVQIKHSL